MSLRCQSPRSDVQWRPAGVSLSPHTSRYLTRMLQADVFYPVPRFFNNWGNFHIKVCGFSLALENNRKTLAVPEPAQSGWNEKQLPIWMADVSWFVSLCCAVPNSDCFGRWPQLVGLYKHPYRGLWTLVQAPTRLPAQPRRTDLWIAQQTVAEPQWVLLRLHSGPSVLTPVLLE